MVAAADLGRLLLASPRCKTRNMVGQASQIMCQTKRRQQGPKAPAFLV